MLVLLVFFESDCEFALSSILTHSFLILLSNENRGVSTGFLLVLIIDDFNLIFFACHFTALFVGKAWRICPMENLDMSKKETVYAASGFLVDLVRFMISRFPPNLAPILVTNLTRYICRFR
jgi:hypothetical protein